MFSTFSAELLELFVSSLGETIVMVGVSGLLGSLIGIPLGVYLRLTDRGSVLANNPANRLVGGIVNAVRSTPFIILLVAVIRHRRGGRAVDAGRRAFCGTAGGVGAA